MKIAIGSDSHDNVENLEKAIQIANENGCEYFLFAGDLISPFALDSLAKFKGNVEMVWGNNEGEKVGIVNKIDKMSNVKMHGDTYDGNIDGKKFFMCHYPNIAELAAKTGEYDMAIHGHTHMFTQEKIGNTLLLNPGNIGGHIEPAGFVIFDIESGEMKKIEL